MENIGKITLQSDENGLITLQCSRCHTRFKVEGEYIDDDLNKEIFCPCCGIPNEKNAFYPQEAIDEAIKIVKAKAEQMFVDAFKGLNSKYIKVKTGTPRKVDTDITIKNRDYDLIQTTMGCCNRIVGLDVIEINAGYYCPYCGRIVK